MCKVDFFQFILKAGLHKGLLTYVDTVYLISPLTDFDVTRYSISVIGSCVNLLALIHINGYLTYRPKLTFTCTFGVLSKTLQKLDTQNSHYHM
jgi:hypothetical protein